MNLNRIICLLFSLISTLEINRLISLNFFLSILLFIIIWIFMYRNLFRFRDKRSVIYSIIFAFIFSFFQIIGYNCSKYDFTYLNKISTYWEIISLIPITYSFASFFINLKFKKIKETNNRIIDLLFNRKYSIFILALLIVIAWTPILYSFYPGNFSYDASTQVNMIKYNVLTKYHPVIHTFFLGNSVILGNHLFSSYNAGIFIYSFIQMLMMAFIFSYTLIFLHKNKLPKYLTIIFLFIYMFLPLHSMLSITTTKDVIFSGLFNLIIIKLITLSKDTDQFFESKSNVISTIIFLFLALTFRNSMLHAFIVFLPYALFAFRKHLKKILVLFLVPLFLFFSYNLILTNVFKIENGPRIETFSFVVQQLARTYNIDHLTNEEKASIEKLYKNGSLKSYNSHISDPVKSNFNSAELFSNLKSYLNLYIRLGIKHPMTYIDSVFTNIYSFFYLNDKLPDPNSKTYIEISCMGENFSRSNECKTNSEFIYDTYFDLLHHAKYQKVPILNIAMNIAFNILLFFLVCVAILKDKKYKLFVPLLLLLCYILTNVLSPVAIVRYVYPVFTCMPLIIYSFYRRENI